MALLVSLFAVLDLKRAESHDDFKCVIVVELFSSLLYVSFSSSTAAAVARSACQPLTPEAAIHGTDPPRDRLILAPAPASREGKGEEETRDRCPA